MKMARMLTASVVPVAALLFCSAPVSAGEEPSGGDSASVDAMQLSLAELMEVKIARVVSASRHEQRITEAPASVTVISADEIKKYGYRTLADIIRSVPGMYISYDRNYTYLGTRGFNRPGDYNSRVLLLIDGHRLNDNLYDTAAIGTEFPLDIDLIDHIEFTRGPGSSLYGSNAFFGTINVFTRKGGDVSRELSASGGDNETWKERVSYGAAYNSGLEVLLSGTLYNSKGQRNIYYPEYAGDPNGPNFQNNDYDRAQSYYTKVRYGDFTLSGIYHTRNKGIPTGAFGTVFNTKPNHTSDDRGYADLSYRKNIGDSVELSARLYYDAYIYQGRYTYDKLGGPPYVVNNDEGAGRWWGGETMAALTVLKDHRVSFGGDFRGNLTTAQTNYDVEPYQSFLNDNRRSNVWGLFVQDEYRVFKSVLLGAGVRYDRYDRINAVNPRASLIYQPTETTTLKLIYGEAFRAPNAYERYYHDSGNTTAANPDVKPEKIRTYEAVWEQYYGKIYNTSVSGYYSGVKNLISQTTDPSSGLLIFRNFNKVDAFGVELALQAKWENGLQGKVSYAWQEAKIAETGERLHNSPGSLAKVNVSVPLYQKAVFLSPELQYTSPRRTLAGNRTKDTVLANLTLFSQDLVKGLEASASVYNLFDTSYSDPGGSEHLQDAIRQDGINFRFKLTYRF